MTGRGKMQVNKALAILCSAVLGFHDYESGLELNKLNNMKESIASREDFLGVDQNPSRSLSTEYTGELSGGEILCSWGGSLVRGIVQLTGRQCER